MSTTPKFRNRSSRFLVALLTATAITGLSSLPTLANPKGGIVVGGSATIEQTSPKELTIHQHTDRAAIEWDSFNIGRDEHTRFVQPNSSSIMLNDITGQASPSRIEGRLSANGRIILRNPNGVLFEKGSRIDVHGLLATAHGIDIDDFMAGKLEFSIPGDPNAMIINRGEINARDAGAIAFVAPGVENSGIIAARLGKITLASGEAFTLDFAGDELVQLVVDAKTAQEVRTADGQTLAALVSNSGTLQADGGIIALQANAVSNIVESVINTDGLVRAQTIEQRDGKITFGGGDFGVVSIASEVDATGTDKGEQGGTIHALGENVGLMAGAELDASGDAGGGAVLVGGDYKGKGDTPTSDAIYVAEATVIRADALNDGDGGRLIFWSDEASRIYGAISARGGEQSGDGGFIETSSENYLDVRGTPDATASNGRAGLWLLDPRDVWIVSGSGGAPSGSPVAIFTPVDDDSYVSTESIVSALNQGQSVEINTGTDGSRFGSIILEDDIVTNGNSSASLTLDANWLVDLRAQIRANQAPLDIIVNAGQIFNRNNASSTIFTNGGDIKFNASDSAKNLQIDTCQTNITNCGNVNITSQGEIQIADIEAKDIILNSNGNTENSLVHLISYDLERSVNSNFISHGNIDIKSSGDILIGQRSNQGWFSIYSNQNFSIETAGRLRTPNDGISGSPSRTRTVYLKGDNGGEISINLNDAASLNSNLNLSRVNLHSFKDFDNHVYTLSSSTSGIDQQISIFHESEGQSVFLRSNSQILTVSEDRGIAIPLTGPDVELNTDGFNVVFEENSVDIGSGRFEVNVANGTLEGEEFLPAEPSPEPAPQPEPEPTPEPEPEPEPTPAPEPAPGDGESSNENDDQATEGLIGEIERIRRPRREQETEDETPPSEREPGIPSNLGTPANELRNTQTIASLINTDQIQIAAQDAVPISFADVSSASVFITEEACDIPCLPVILRTQNGKEKRFLNQNEAQTFLTALIANRSEPNSSAFRFDAQYATPFEVAEVMAREGVTATDVSDDPSWNQYSEQFRNNALILRQQIVDWTINYGNPEEGIITDTSLLFQGAKRMSNGIRVLENAQTSEDLISSAGDVSAGLIEILLSSVHSTVIEVPTATAETIYETTVPEDTAAQLAQLASSSAEFLQLEAAAKAIIWVKDNIAEEGTEGRMVLDDAVDLATAGGLGSLASKLGRVDFGDGTSIESASVRSTDLPQETTQQAIGSDATAASRNTPSQTEQNIAAIRQTRSDIPPQAEFTPLTESAFNPPNSFILFKDQSGDEYLQSPAGLVYEPGSIDGHRLVHALSHTKPNPTKEKHTVFSTQSDAEALELIDEAWLKRGQPLEGDPGAFIIPMNRVVGSNGETSVRIVVDPGTSILVTAFPE